MKGIILAGGDGTRLYPLTRCISKQLLPVYDKPMIYYPLSVLMNAGIRNILIITTARDLANFKQLLGDGSQLGICLNYAVQAKPEGLAQAFLIGETFIGKDHVCLILGDNIFYGEDFTRQLRQAVQHHDGATIFTCRVPDPERFGVIEFDANGQAVAIEEKPRHPKSNHAVTGLYLYDNQVINLAKQIRPSARGQLEITDINQAYLKQKQLRVITPQPEFVWLDMGTPDSLLAAGQWVADTERKLGIKIAAHEELTKQKRWRHENTRQSDEISSRPRH